MDPFSPRDLPLVGDTDSGVTTPDVNATALGKEKATQLLFPKPPKPPRTSEISAPKKARIEPIRALRKTKNYSAASSKFSTVCALFVTVSFFLIIAWEGKENYFYWRGIYRLYVYNIFLFIFALIASTSNHLVFRSSFLLKEDSGFVNTPFHRIKLQPRALVCARNCIWNVNLVNFLFFLRKTSILKLGISFLHFRS